MHDVMATSSALVVIRQIYTLSACVFYSLNYAIADRLLDSPLLDSAIIRIHIPTAHGQ